MRYSDSDIRFLARVIGETPQAAATHMRAWQLDPEQITPWLDDERVLRQLMSDDHSILEVSPRFLFTVLLRRIRRDLATIPYTVERVEPDGRVVVFDAPVVHELLQADEMFQYLVNLLVSFERIDTVTVRGARPRSPARRLNTFSMDDMVELAGLVDPPLRPAICRRIGDIALFVTGVFQEAVRRRAQRPLASPFAQMFVGRWRGLEEYEADGRRFYGMAADQLRDVQPDLSRVLARLAGDFTIARKPLAVLAERYVTWARPHWAGGPS
ncbi:MAG TPA: hypothetical protein VFM39_05940 [bacterium]|nr:hypothetical protein [bacterium]